MCWIPILYILFFNCSFFFIPLSWSSDQIVHWGFSPKSTIIYIIHPCNNTFERLSHIKSYVFSLYLYNWNNIILVYLKYLILRQIIFSNFLQSRNMISLCDTLTQVRCYNPCCYVSLLQFIAYEYFVFVALSEALKEHSRHYRKLVVYAGRDFKYFIESSRRLVINAH